MSSAKSLIMSTSSPPSQIIEVRICTIGDDAVPPGGPRSGQCQREELWRRHLDERRASCTTLPTNHSRFRRQSSARFCALMAAGALAN